MTSAARSLLLTTSFYFAALGVVVAGLYASVSMLAPAVQAHFLRSGERTPSRLDYLAADARTIRQALATPVAPVEPLPPVTARPLRPPVAAKPEQKPEHERKASSRRRSTEARNAYAMSERDGGGATTMSADRYRPQ